jgi:hypothetical protein
MAIKILVLEERLTKNKRSKYKMKKRELRKYKSSLPVLQRVRQ